MSDDRRFREVNDYAGVHGYFTGFPNFHEADYGNGTVYGTILLRDAEAEWRDVPRTEYGVNRIEDVPAMFRAANDYAARQGYPAAFPNFHQADYGQGVVYGTILIKPGITQWRDVPRIELGVNTIDDVGAMMRAANDYAARNGFPAGFPTFHQADYGQGVVCGIVLFNPGTTAWRDLPADLLSAYSRPTQPWAVILCNLSDRPPGPNSNQRYVDYFTGPSNGIPNAFNYFYDVSYGTGGLQGTRVFGWLDLGHTTAELLAFVGSAQRAQAFKWGMEAVSANNIDLSAFPHKIVVLNGGGNDHGKTGSGVVLVYADTTPFEPTFFFHEMGHEFGMDHSFGEQPAPCVGGDARPGAYCDVFDIMSAMNVNSFNDAQNRRAGPGLNALSRERLGWLHRSRVWNMPGSDFSENVVLAALDRPYIECYQMAKFRAPSRNPAQQAPSTYTLEFREAAGWDQGLPNDMVVIHEVRTDGLIRLLTNSNGGSLVPGADFIFPNRSAFVRLVGIDAPNHMATLRIWDAPEGSLRKEDSNPRVYLIRNGTKCWVTSPQVLIALGRSWGEVRSVPDGGLNSIPVGPDIGMLQVSVTPYPVPLNRTITVTVHATDSITGNNLAGQVKVDGRIVGSTNVPFTRAFRSRRVPVDTIPRTWEVIYPQGTVITGVYPETPIDFGFPDV